MIDSFIHWLIDWFDSIRFDYVSFKMIDWLDLIWLTDWFIWFDLIGSLDWLIDLIWFDWLIDWLNEWLNWIGLDCIGLDWIELGWIGWHKCIPLCLNRKFRNGSSIGVCNYVIQSNPIQSNPIQSNPFQCNAMQWINESMNQSFNQSINRLQFPHFSNPFSQPPYQA